MTLNAEVIGQAIVGVFVAISSIHSMRANKKREHEAVAQIKMQSETNRKIDRVAAYVVGPDGKGGIRKDHEELKDRVDGLEERERDRLHGPYTPPPTLPRSNP